MSTGPARLDTRAGDEAPDTRAWLAFALHASGASRWEIPIPEDTLPLTELWQRLTGDERATAIPRADLARLREPLADLLEGRLAEVSFEFRYTGLDGRPCPRRSVMRLIPCRPPNGRPALLRGLNFARVPPTAAETMPDLAPEIARKADRRFETFSRAVADELRAPTRAISGFAHRLDKLHGEALPALARELLTRLGGAARAMDDAVEALAGFARLAGTPLEPERVDLADLARRVWQEYDSRDGAHAARLEIDCRAAPLVLADPALVRIVLRNLFDNARKFSRNDPRSVVSFAWSPGTPSHFFVRDRGAGFDLANAKALFEPFGRQHSPSEFEGTGIGLATVRLLVERHGGRVWAESRPGEGATFRFTLPSA